MQKIAIQARSGAIVPCGNHEPCLTTPECPGFKQHPLERPEFLSPLLLLFLRFIEFSAAPRHCRNASTAFTGMRAGGRAGYSTRFWPCTCPHHQQGSQTATNAVSRVLDRSCYCLRSTWSARAECKASQWWAAARAPLAHGTGIAKTFRPGLFDQDIVRF